MTKGMAISERNEEQMKQMLEEIQKGNKEIIPAFFEFFKVGELPVETHKLNPNEDLFFVDLEALSFEWLMLLYQHTSWHAPAFFLRRKCFGEWKTLEDDVLLTLMQTLSGKAKDELVHRYQHNLYQATDELLVLMAQDQNAEALDVLFERYLPIVKMSIRRLGPRFVRGYNIDDLIQEGAIGLFKSKDDFKIERKTNFKDFSRYVIKKHIGTLILRSTNYKNISLNESFSYHSPIGSDSEMTFEQLLKSDANGPELVTVNRETFFAIEEKLTDLEKEVLKYYALGLSYEEIGELLGKNKKVIDNTIQRFRKKGKQYLKNHLN